MIDVAGLASIGRIRKYAAGDIIFREGDQGQDMYIVLSGLVQTYHQPAGGSQMLLSDYSPGNFFGEMSLLEGLPRSACAQAIQGSVLISLDQEHFQTALARDPSLAYRMLKELSGRLREQNDKLFRQGKKGASSCTTPTQAAGLASRLFPPGHKSYPVSASAEHEKYLFDKEIPCPVCSQAFTVKKVTTSRLKLDKVEACLRQRFEEFEPLWYAVWVCPDCGYANFSSDFERLSEKNKTLLRQQANELQKEGPFGFSIPRRLDQVFSAYYLALHSASTTGADSYKLARLWLNLAWLYEDAKDENMSLLATGKAREYYKDAYYNSKRKLPLEEEQRLSFLLGELHLCAGQREEASKFYYSSVVRQGGNAGINELARDRLQELKQKRG